MVQLVHLEVGSINQMSVDCTQFALRKGKIHSPSDPISLTVLRRGQCVDLRHTWIPQILNNASVA
jgi:hypothetical protein